MSPDIITCQGMSHTYRGSIKALNNINLSIKKGEVIGIVGQNGSGKTTLVKHFNGMLRPTEGKILYRKEDIIGKPVHEMSRLVGYVFQNPNHQLFSSSVEKELEFGPANLELPEDIIRSRVNSALEFFNLESVRNVHPYRLSFPLRKLVCIASIFTLQPNVFVLDEPTTGQDHRGIELIRNCIRKISSVGHAVIIVSHDMPLIAEVTKRMIVLWKGSIIADGHPRNVFLNQDVLEQSQLKPPQITQLSINISLIESPIKLVPVALSVEEYTKEFDKLNLRIKHDE